MRTKFLATDYFHSNQTLPFLRLPLPHLQPHPISRSFDLEQNYFHRLDSSPSPQFHSFPIGDAFSKFLSDVLPQTIDVGNCDCFSEKGSDIAHAESATEACVSSSSEIWHERTKGYNGDKDINVPALLQLEVPELGQDLESACMSVEEKVELILEAQESEDNLEMLNVGHADSYRCINDIVKAISLDIDTEQKPQIPEEPSPFPDNVRSSDYIFPLFEVDEVGLEDPARTCIEDLLHSYFENTEVKHCTKNDDLELNCQRLLGSAEIDILELIDGHHASKLNLDLECLNSAPDVDILQVVENPTGIIDVHLFEEIEMLDSDSFDVLKAHSICQLSKEPETCHELFHGDVNFKGFDDLIVSGELALIDDSFMSLPVPTFKDDDKTLSVHVVVTGIFTKVEPVPLSASDEIYLDWHLLGEDKCSNNVVSAVEKVFHDDVQETTLDLSQLPNDGGMLMLDLLLLDDPLNLLNVTENKLDMPSVRSCTVGQEINTVSSSSLSDDDDCQIIENAENPANAQSRKDALGKLSDEDCQIIEDTMLTDDDLGKPAPSASMSHFNDLDFFLNPRKATGNMKVDRRLKTPNDKPVFSNSPHKRKATPLVQPQKPHAQLHTLSLPANFIVLIDNLQSSYLAVFDDYGKRNGLELSLTSPDDLNLLGLSEESLKEQVTNSRKQQSFIGHADDNVMDIVTLCTIKHMAWCLCYWGIDTLHLFMSKLFQHLGCLKSRLRVLHSLIVDAYVEADKDISKSHPSVATIKEILQMNSNRNGKVLILAQQLLWGSLKRLLTSMDVTLTEVEDSCMLENLANLCHDFLHARAAGPSNRLKTACLLLSPENISQSILAQKFDIVLEYGGPRGISKVSTLSSGSIGAQSHHFLKIGMDGPAKALCEGVAVASGDRSTVKLEDMLNFLSITENQTLGSSEAIGKTSPRSGLNRPVHCMPQESMPTQPNSSSYPNVIIVINTGISDKDMIISRRSTYQKILALEKRGGQVVERDLIPPVDIVVDATTCIAWYDLKNIVNKTIPQDESSSSIPICIDNIAANVLTSLSFMFTVCILIFEGESAFLGSVMESADQLYVAAAGLGIQLQIFCSHSSELTDEIILNFLDQTFKSFKRVLPRLPESETLAESFLTKFPSLNPLSAHTIISSGLTLLEFLELSFEGRIQALRKFHVPEESINLFSVCCKFGELEGSKSALTDCSSSMSSPSDSGNVGRKINSEDRKRKFISSSFDVLQDSRCPMPCGKYTDDERLITRKPLDPDLSSGEIISPKSKLFDEKLFDTGDLLDPISNEDLSDPWWRSNDMPGAPQDPQMEDGFAQSSLLSNDRFADRRKRGTTSGTCSEYDGDLLQDLAEDLLDVTNIYSQAEQAVTSSPFVNKTVTTQAPEHDRTYRRLLFGECPYPTFPSAEELNMSFGLEDDSQLTANENCTISGYNWRSSSLKPPHQKESMGGSSIEKPTQKFGMPLPKKKEFSSYSEKPLSKAISSEKLKQGSPWTIEFLTRQKEKRKVLQQRQQPLYAGASSHVPLSIHRGDLNRATPTKRRTPSILEFYKRQSGNTPTRVPSQQKRQKQDDQVVNERPSGYNPTWTPTDKRARQTLSYAPSGTRGQAKLVWRDNVSGSHRSRFSE